MVLAKRREEAIFLTYFSEFVLSGVRLCVENFGSYHIFLRKAFFVLCTSCYTIVTTHN